MAITTRGKRHAEPSAAEPAAEPDLAAEPAAEPDLAAVVEVLARFTAKLIVHVSGLHAVTAASFRQIVVQELRLGSQADVDLIEAWLAAHPDG
jgi:hypothetical protein